MRGVCHGRFGEFWSPDAGDTGCGSVMKGDASGKKVTEEDIGAADLNLTPKEAEVLLQGLREADMALETTLVKAA